MLGPTQNPDRSKIVYFFILEIIKKNPLQNPYSIKLFEPKIRTKDRSTYVFGFDIGWSLIVE